MTRPYSKSQFILPARYVDVDEMALLFGYTQRIGVLHAINRGCFPIATFKFHGMRVALREAVREYFQKQVDAAIKYVEDKALVVDRRLIAREKREVIRARKLKAAEILAQRLALKEQKRKEAVYRRYLKATDKVRESVSHVALVGTRKR